jgi:virulence-associated protein VagC
MTRTVRWLLALEVVVFGLAALLHAGVLTTGYERAIVLEPVPHSWEWLDALTGELDDDFVAAARERPEATERPELRKVFR